MPVSSRHKTYYIKSQIDLQISKEFISLHWNFSLINKLSVF